MYQTLFGIPAAESILSEVKKTIATHKLKAVLGIVVVGEDKPSQVYVQKKCEKAAEVGVEARVFRFPESVSEKELLKEIEKLNKDKSLHGFIVQMPVPKHINPNKIIDAINPSKDVDGFTSSNMGKVMQNILDEETCWPATPFGVIRMLEFYKVPLAGKKAVVIGRGNVVGKPLSMMLLHKDCTVTLCHSKTQDLKRETLNADIVIAAAGHPKLVTGDMVKSGAYVIDVGTSRVEIEGKVKVVGDCDFESVIKKTHCSPVPKGVGPLTVAMLIANTVKAAMRKK